MFFSSTYSGLYYEINNFELGAVIEALFDCDDCLGEWRYKLNRLLSIERLKSSVSFSHYEINVGINDEVGVL